FSLRSHLPAPRDRIAEGAYSPSRDQETRDMSLSRWTRFCLAAAGVMLWGALLTPAPVGAGPNGKGGGNSGGGGGGDDTPTFIPVPAIFEALHAITVDDGSEAPLDDSALAA